MQIEEGDLIADSPVAWVYVETDTNEFRSTLRDERLSGVWELQFNDMRGKLSLSSLNSCLDVLSFIAIVKRFKLKIDMNEWSTLNFNYLSASFEIIQIN